MSPLTLKYVHRPCFPRRTVSASLPRALRSSVAKRATPSSKERRSPVSTFVAIALSCASCEKLILKAFSPKVIGLPKQNPPARIRRRLFRDHPRFQHLCPCDRYEFCARTDRSATRVVRRWRGILPSWPLAPRGNQCESVTPIRSRGKGGE